ncbi:sensor domain-containing diguanylate cyclase [Rossellomorea sp. BNER]|nr:sensor domain-containing diguanylate cyclase [Rossellomorea sp. BNER]
MDWSNEYFLHIYKSRLYELMNVDSSTNTVNIHHWYREWFKIVKDCFQAQDTVYYQWMGEEYRLVHPSTDYNVGFSMSSQSVDALFYYHSFIYRSSERKEDTFPYDVGFKLMENDSAPLGILFVQGTQINMTQLLESDLIDFVLESELFLKKMYYFYKVIEDEHRYRELFKVTEIFHSTMDIDLLLGQVITTLYRVFPDYSFNLLLSNDNHKHEDLPINNFEYDTADIAAMQSFVNGTIEIADSTQAEQATLYAPLKGKQGVYGVLEVCTTHSFNYPDHEIEFIRLLAYTAGSALENAKLYQQSKNLISDLQLINEIYHKLNSDLRMSETLTFLKCQIERSFQASAVAFIMINQESQVLKESSSFFLSENGNRYIQFVKSRIVKENDSLFIGDISTKLEGEIPYFSLMAVPMVQNNLLKGFCIVLQEKPYSFSFDMYKLLQSFIHHSTLALTNSMLREELEKMVITDHLTNLYARRYLDGEMKKSLKRDHGGSYILLDLDNFKEINDRYGHQVGDEVLIQTATIIQTIVEGKGLPARWGGEEIAVYFPNYSAADSKVVADEMVKRIPKETSPSITVSCGISSWSDNKDVHVKSLIRRADSALYIAKNNGRNQVVTEQAETSIR